MQDAISAAKKEAAEIAAPLVKEMARVAALWAINDRFVNGGGAARVTNAAKDAVEALEAAFFPDRATTIGLWQLLETETQKAEGDLVQALEGAGVDVRHKWELQQ